MTVFGSLDPAMPESSITGLFSFMKQFLLNSILVGLLSAKPPQTYPLQGVPVPTCRWLFCNTKLFCFFFWEFTCPVFYTFRASPRQVI